jgi:hypothetical protein
MENSGENEEIEDNKINEKNKKPVNGTAINESNRRKAKNFWVIFKCNCNEEYQNMNFVTIHHHR